ncbi:MAG: NAD-dependent epimerase/dehydratase family protein [Candidatus Omnitrophica bacterium]|nr:NAD-dependent epimerase/dehydratase family protein [Candidatus Omnitrophota bacterium]
MQALVLGATGHIGAHVVRALLAEGHSVRAAYRSGRFLHVIDGLPVERVRVDLDTLEGLPHALEGCEWVFQAAGYYPRLFGRPREAIARGVETTRRLIEHLRRAHPQRIVFTSSAATIEGRGPNSLYVHVKLAMEQEMARAAGEGLPVVIVNPSVCLGEYDAHRFSGRLILVCARYPLLFSFDGAFNAIYTGDVGVGLLRAAQRGRLGERYAMTTRHIALREFAALVAEAMGRRPPRWRLPWQVRSSWPLDGRVAIRELGLPQTPVEEAIRRAVAWFRSQGDL